MKHTKTIVLGAIFAAIAALFQLIPFLFSEILVLLTVFSAIPIYIISRINPKAGILSYFVAGSIIMFFTVHEGVLFFCTNGILGVSLGIGSFYLKRKGMVWIIGSILLAISLSLVNYGFGIPIFGGEIPGRIIVQLGIIFIFSVFYNMIYSYFLNFIYQRLKQSGFVQE